VEIMEPQSKAKRKADLVNKHTDDGGRQKKLGALASTEGGALPSDASPEVKCYQKMLEEACSNHVNSFDTLVEHNLAEICKILPRLWIAPKEKKGVQVKHTEEDLIYYWFHSLKIDAPKKNARGYDAQSSLLPSDCRLAHTTYSAPLRARIKCRRGTSGPVREEDVELGNIPIMVKSTRCNLYGKTPEELTKLREDPTERGGYFIINGNERVIRLLIQQKSNYIIALVRPSFQNRGPLYSEYATQMRCMRRDLSTLTNSLHYCKDGMCFFRFSHDKNEWLLPLIVVSFLLFDGTESFMYTALTGGGDDHYLTERVALMLQRQQDSQIGVNSQKGARNFLGKRFRHTLRNVPDTATDEQVGIELTKQFFFVHTENNLEKFESLVLMFQKLMSLTQGKIEPDNCDALSLQDAMLPGQLYGAVLKEALEEHLHRTSSYIKKLQSKNPALVVDVQKIKDCMTSMADLDKQMEYFLATGNVRSRTGLDLMQMSGFTVVADKINAFRYLSHFRSIHRGAFFTELRTTTVRKLLPDTWGFLCPVHTPDGTPCGLLNHLAARCEAVTRYTRLDDIKQHVRDILRECSGVYGIDDPEERVGLNRKEFSWVVLDGQPIGRVAYKAMHDVAVRLRNAKKTVEGIPHDMEIVYISQAWDHLFTGIYMFSAPCRMVRPVRCTDTKSTEWIGPLEQLFLNISATSDDLNPTEPGTQTQGTKLGEQQPTKFTHVEIAPTEILSFLAGMTPFSNHNQSPRNMYQCQMLKQTMGTPYLNHPYRTDNKIYKIQTPQRPMVRTQLYGKMVDTNAHPPGVNAVIAVISYTGYDMEDAMILNRASLQRGFFHGHVYKQKIIQAYPDRDYKRAKEWKFTTYNEEKQKKEWANGSKTQLEPDGFPAIGTKLTRGDALCMSISEGGQVETQKWKDDEDAYLEQINLCQGGALPSSSFQDSHIRASLKLRINRDPIIGDKFASRHGQKGVVAVTWPQENMPFSENGMVPDILFNPHGFPSRMTVGMLIESIAGKAAMLTGLEADASTFRKYKGEFGEAVNNEEDPFLEKDACGGGGGSSSSAKAKQLEGAAYFGQALAKRGYQYWGTEQLYNGMTGEMMPVQIFKGIVYYQRLRHMVSDKMQVRNVGKVDPMTKQPIKGRKVHGGIRFGEMERDSLLAHGCSFLLHDRLFRCSDYHIGNVCPECGYLMTAVPSAGPNSGQLGSAGISARMLPYVCVPCSKEKKRDIVCHRVPIPYVFRYLTCELAAMNINLQLKLHDTDKAVKPTRVPMDIE